MTVCLCRKGAWNPECEVHPPTVDADRPADWIDDLDPRLDESESFDGVGFAEEDR